MKSTVLALAVVLLPAVALSSPASDEQETAVAMTRGAAVASRLAAEAPFITKISITVPGVEPRFLNP